MKPDPLGADTVLKACPDFEGRDSRFVNQICAMSANQAPGLDWAELGRVKRNDANTS